MKRYFWDYVFSVTKRIYNLSVKKRLFARKYEYINRSHNFHNLLLIIAGFQPFYWEGVLGRVRLSQMNFGEDLDICVCVPGEDGTELKRYCEKYGWSYLGLTQDLLSQAQNTAIKLHPNAKWIYKIDEDIIIEKNYDVV